MHVYCTLVHKLRFKIIIFIVYIHFIYVFIIICVHYIHRDSGVGRRERGIVASNSVHTIHIGIVVEKRERDSGGEKRERDSSIKQCSYTRLYLHATLHIHVLLVNLIVLPQGALAEQGRLLVHVSSALGHVTNGLYVHVLTYQYIM